MLLTIYPHHMEAQFYMGATNNDDDRRRRRRQHDEVVILRMRHSNIVCRQSSDSIQK